jgi:hypothetical protein
MDVADVYEVIEIAVFLLFTVDFCFEILFSKRHFA